MFTSDARERFTAMAQLAERDIDLLAASLLIAKEEHGELRVIDAVREVDGIADRLRGVIGPRSGMHNAVYAINHVLFDQLGFRGNVASYDDPDNCMMHQVLRRRLGLPITLSLLYMEVGRRLGLAVHGVGLPGHFVVRCDDPSFGPVFVDPFHSGRIVLRADLDALLRRLTTNRVRLHEAHLRPATRRSILTRMLQNLKSIYYRRGDFERTLMAVERIVILNPAARDELRDRGLLYGLTGHREAAIADLEDYLDRWPDAPDAPRVRQHLSGLRTARKGTR